MDLCIYPPRPVHASGKAGTKQSHQHDTRQHSKFNTASTAGKHEPQQHASDKAHNAVPVAAGCTEETIMEVIRGRDPAHIGLPNQAAVRLLLMLLHWNPAQRPTAAEALRHAFFVMPLHTNITAACNQDRSLSGWC